MFRKSKATLIYSELAQNKNHIFCFACSDVSSRGLIQALGLAEHTRIMHALFEYRPARPPDIDYCIEIRGLTRENAISVSRLAELGITSDSWSEQVKVDSLPGIVCVSEGRIVGYCFGHRQSGEIVVLALLPEVENKGVGKMLLHRVVKVLIESGHARLYLGCASDPTSRSYGFYRHLGWRTTNQFDMNGDEILEYHPAENSEV